MRLRAFAIFLFTVTASPVFGQVSLDLMASQFEQSLDCGRRIWDEEEVASLLEALVSYAPHLAPKPRIAGTHGVISENTRSGYYGGVYFGPIPVSNRQIDYYGVTIWGDIERGWEFNQYIHHRAILPDNHPTWLLLEDADLRDDFEVTEEQALSIVRTVREMAEQNVRSTDGELLVSLTPEQIDQLHRFEGSYWTPPDFLIDISETPEWWAGHFVITAKIQRPGSHKNVYQAGVQFAVTDEGLTFIRAIPEYDVFDFLGLQRGDCSFPVLE